MPLTFCKHCQAEARVLAGTKCLFQPTEFEKLESCSNCQAGVMQDFPNGTRFYCWCQLGQRRRKYVAELNRQEGFR